LRAAQGKVGAGQSARLVKILSGLMRGWRMAPPKRHPAQLQQKGQEESAGWPCQTLQPLLSARPMPL